VLAYKFLDGGRRSIYTGTTWQPDTWVHAEVVDVCRSGIHACAAADLAWWLSDELWVIELAGDTDSDRHKVVAASGRLVRRIEAYPAAVRELGEIATWRARDRAVAGLTRVREVEAADAFAAVTTIPDLRALRRWAFEHLDQSTASGALATLAADAAALLTDGAPAEAPFAGCCSAGVAATLDGGGRRVYDEAYEGERRWQSRWLADRLALG
jgi:hypothetical protein